MNTDKSTRIAGAVVAASLILCMSGFAQQLPQASRRRAAAYDVTRESVIEGKVLQYSATSKTPPMGAQLSLQTSLGAVYVHLGNARMLDANHLSLQVGESVRITGENLSFGSETIFVARLIQKGSQSVAVRSKTGMPLLPTARTADGKISQPAGAR
jgi:hypothetical protein